MSHHPINMHTYIYTHIFIAAWNAITKRLSMKCCRELCKWIGFYCPLLLPATEIDELQPTKNKHKLLFLGSDLHRYKTGNN